MTKAGSYDLLLVAFTRTCLRALVLEGRNKGVWALTDGTVYLSGEGCNASMGCKDSCAFHTTGHLMRAIGAFLELLTAHRNDLVVGVRRWPTSWRLPHFSHEAVMAALARGGIEYVWREDLGGAERPRRTPPTPRGGRVPSGPTLISY